MSSSVGTLGTSGAQSTSRGYDAFQSVNTEDFIKILVTELQYQDPLEPTDSSQILEQVSQIRQIESTQRLNDTMAAVMLGQNLATASSLLDRNVLGLDDNGNPVVGTVDRVSIESGTIKIYVGDSVISLSNVAQILS